MLPAATATLGPSAPAFARYKDPAPRRKSPPPQKNHLHFPAEFGILYKFPVFRERKQNVRS